MIVTTPDSAGVMDSPPREKSRPRVEEKKTWDRSAIPMPSMKAVLNLPNPLMTWIIR